MLETKLEKALKIAQLGFALMVGIFVVFGTLSLLFSRDPESSRIAEIIRLLNDNWKVLIVTLIPLFYPTVRALLTNMKKGPWGIEICQQMEAPPELRPNPPPEKE
jgi:hypothetical protein